MKKINTASYFLIAATIIGAAFLAISVNSKIVTASETCPTGNGWTKDEQSPFSYSAPTGYKIDQVCVKGGEVQNPNGYLFTTSTNGVGHTCSFYNGPHLRTGSVSVSGIGTNQASASKSGYCADVSHASFHIVLNSTPTPTRTPSPTLSPSPTNTPEPTRIPSATPIPTNIPSVTPTNTPSPAPTDIPYVSPTPIIEISLSPEPTTSPEPTSYISPTPTPGGQGGPECDNNMIYDANLNICISCPGEGNCEVVIGASPTPAPTAAPTSILTAAPTATPVPAQGGTSSSSSNSSSNESKNEAASVTAFANTGNFANSASNAVFAIGASLSAISAAWYGKKKKTNKKK